jgi:hypothetical protein
MMQNKSQRGEINVLLIPVILLALFLTGAIAFGYWAFSERQDYKFNSDKKSAAAANAARKDEDIIKDKAFVEAEKQPLTGYDGPEAYGSVHVDYPKTWSVYINSLANDTQPLDSYFNPRIVPSVQDQSSVYALRVQIVTTAYSKVVAGYASAVKQGQVTVNPYALPKVPGVTGVRIDGLIHAGKKNTGSMVVLPLRDKSIEIWTENAQAIGDYNNIILPNITFQP